MSEAAVLRQVDDGVQEQGSDSMAGVRGRLRLVAKMFRADVRCFSCGAMWVRDVGSKGAAESLLHTSGWKKIGTHGYFCDSCTSGVSRRAVGLAAAGRATAQNELVKLLLRGQPWDPEILMKLLKITRARLYQLVTSLEQRGLVNPVSKRLNVQGTEIYLKRQPKVKAKAEEVAGA